MSMKNCDHIHMKTSQCALENFKVARSSLFAEPACARKPRESGVPCGKAIKLKNLDPTARADSGGGECELNQKREKKRGRPNILPKFSLHNLL